VKWHQWYRVILGFWQRQSYHAYKFVVADVTVWLYICGSEHLIDFSICQPLSYPSENPSQFLRPDKASVLWITCFERALYFFYRVFAVEVLVNYLKKCVEVDVIMTPTFELTKIIDCF